MSKKRYIDAVCRLSDQQHEAIVKCYMKGVNNDGHAWVTWSDVEDLIADLFLDDDQADIDKKIQEAGDGLF